MTGVVASQEEFNTTGLTPVGYDSQSYASCGWQENGGAPLLTDVVIDNDRGTVTTAQVSFWW